MTTFPFTLHLPDGRQPAVELPANFSLRRLIPALTSKLDLPTHNEDGNPLHYHIHSHPDRLPLPDSTQLDGKSILPNSRLYLIATPVLPPTPTTDVPEIIVGETTDATPTPQRPLATPPNRRQAVPYTPPPPDDSISSFWAKLFSFLLVLVLCGGGGYYSFSGYAVFRETATATATRFPTLTSPPTAFYSTITPKPLSAIPTALPSQTPTPIALSPLVAMIPTPISATLSLFPPDRPANPTLLEAQDIPGVMQPLIWFDEQLLVAFKTVTNTHLYRANEDGFSFLAPLPHNQIPQLVEVGEQLFFVGQENDQLTLVASQSPLTETNRVLTLTTPHLALDVELTAVDGDLFFLNDDGEHGLEVWRMPAFSTPPYMVQDIRSDQNSSLPSQFTVVNDVLFFRASEQGYGESIWRSAVLDDGSVRFADICPDCFTAPESLVPLGDKLLFSAIDGKNGRELWISDGTPANTRMLKNILDGGRSSTPRLLTTLGDQLFFTATDNEHGQELWVTDGTQEGTHLVADLNDGDTNSYPRNLIPLAEGRLLFTAIHPYYGREWWVTNGTEAGTFLLRDINAGISDGLEANVPMLQVNNLLFFTADDGEHGKELWVTDGSQGGTTMLFDLAEGELGSSPTNFVASPTHLYFNTQIPPRSPQIYSFPLNP